MKRCVFKAYKDEFCFVGELAHFEIVALRSLADGELALCEGLWTFVPQNILHLIKLLVIKRQRKISF